MFNLLAGETTKLKMVKQGTLEGTLATIEDELPPLDGTFEDVCGEFNASMKTNCLRKKEHYGEIHSGPDPLVRGFTVSWGPAPQRQGKYFCPIMPSGRCNYPNHASMFAGRKRVTA